MTSRTQVAYVFAVVSMSAGAGVAHADNPATVDGTPVQVAGYHGGSTNLSDVISDYWVEPDEWGATCGGDYPVMKGASAAQNHHWSAQVLCAQAPEGLVVDEQRTWQAVLAEGDVFGDYSGLYTCEQEYSKDSVLVGLAEKRDLDFWNGRHRSVLCAHTNKHMENCSIVDFVYNDGLEPGGEWTEWSLNDNKGVCGPNRVATGVGIRPAVGATGFSLSADFSVTGYLRCCDMVD